MGKIAKSCCEVSFVLEHLAIEDKARIPQSVFLFFQEHSDPSYEVKLDISKPLVEQELLDETKAFIKILYQNYFEIPKKKQNDNEDYRTKLQSLNHSSPSVESLEERRDMETKDKLLTSYKENKIKSLIHKIISIFRKSS